jgi:macrolide-specific efflux system membrane fusion protein
MVVRAPIDGRFVVQTTWRGPSDESEFREGDRAWPGAVIAEIPDPASLCVAARVDEVDRGRLAPGMIASVRPDAVPGLEAPARLTSVSSLSRPDYSSWPPQRVFDIVFSLDAHDSRFRFGMSTAIRVTVDRLEQALLIPTSAVHQAGSRTFVYVKTRAGFEERSIVLDRQNREIAAVAHGLQPGEEVVTRATPDQRSVWSGSTTAAVPP